MKLLDKHVCNEILIPSKLTILSRETFPTSLFQMIDGVMGKNGIFFVGKFLEDSLEKHKHYILFLE